MTTPGERAEMGNGFVLPTWFVRIAAAVIALSVPWFVWTTVTLVRIDVRLEHMSTAAESRDVVIAQLQATINSHMADPDIHHAMLRVIEARINGLEEKLRNQK